MKLAEAESTGALEMSAFHQLSGGNSGNGTNNGPPSVLVANSQADVIAAMSTTPKARTASLMNEDLRNDDASDERLRNASISPFWACSFAIVDRKFVRLKLSRHPYKGADLG